MQQALGVVVARIGRLDLGGTTIERDSFHVAVLASEDLSELNIGLGEAIVFAEGQPQLRLRQLQE